MYHILSYQLLCYLIYYYIIMYCIGLLCTYLNMYLYLYLDLCLYLYLYDIYLYDIYILYIYIYIIYIISEFMSLSPNSTLDSGICASQGTVLYLSPEMIRREGHGLALDFYCLGCLLQGAPEVDPRFDLRMGRASQVD